MIQIFRILMVLGIIKSVSANPLRCSNIPDSESTNHSHALFIANGNKLLTVKGKLTNDNGSRCEEVENFKLSITQTEEEGQTFENN